MSIGSNSFHREGLQQLGIQEINYGPPLAANGSWRRNDPSYTPVDSSLIGKVTTTSKKNTEQVMQTAVEAFSILALDARPQRGGNCSTV